MKAIAKKKSSGGVLETVKTIVYAILIALVVRTVAYEPFNIPSGSMIPTLLVGDYLFVSKFSYGYSRFSLPFGLPLFPGRILEFHKPERGDVAVFKLPTDTSTDYIKRIVGLPGDKIQMIHGNLFINGQMVPRRQVDDYVYQEGGAVVLMHQYIESLPRGPSEPPLEHPIIKIGDDGPLDNQSSVFHCDKPRSGAPAPVRKLSRAASNYCRAEWQRFAGRHCDRATLGAHDWRTPRTPGFYDLAAAPRSGFACEAISSATACTDEPLPQVVA